MPNTILTINMITREALRLFKNSNAFLQNVDRQYDDQFAKTGAKIGQTLRIRLPNDFTVRTGAAASVQSTDEVNTALTIATQQGVDIAFTSAERALSLDDYSKRILAPAINNLAASIAANLMGSSEQVCNLSGNFDGNGNIISPSIDTWLGAGSLLDDRSSPRGDRKIVMAPRTQARTVTSLAGLFNPSAEISRQYRSGEVKSALGFDWMMDQTSILHTTGTATGITVNGAGQTGTTLLVNALNGTLNAGDIITIQGVDAVNRLTKQDTGALMTFAVTQSVGVGATQISVYPALTPPVGGLPVQYQTVTASPANNAPISLVTNAGSTFRKNFAYVPEAVTFVTADLELPKGVHEADRQVYDDVSMRIVTQYNVMTDQMVTRLDVLYGYVWVRPEWGVIVPDVA